MNQAELVRKLDEHFGVSAFDEREGWQQKIPPADLGVYRRYVRPEFSEGTWNGLMLDNAAWDRVADKLVVEDFYRREHQLIYQVIKKITIM